MLGLLTGLIGGALAPLMDQLSSASARLLRKAALFLVAGACLVVMLIALTIAFDLWIASLAGPIVGALAVAGLYLAIAALAVLLALRDGAPKETVEESAANQEQRTQDKAFDARVDQVSAPLLALLQQFGLKRELVAVLAGTSVAKRLGPLPLVGLAIVGGFLIGRMWKNWRGLLSSEALMGLVAASGLFGGGPTADPESKSDDQTA
jgi:hypothetical protein